jgi:putative protease
LLLELEKVSHRPFTRGFAAGDPGKEGQAPMSASYIQTHELMAVVLEYNAVTGCALVEQRNRFCSGDTLEILSPGDIHRSFAVKGMHSADGEAITCAPHPQQHVYLNCPHVQPGDLLRRAMKNG